MAQKPEDRSTVSRRDAMTTIAGAGIALGSAPALALAAGRPQASGITVFGQPVEVTVSSVSRVTARISALALVDGVAQRMVPDGALEQEKWGLPVATLRDLPASKRIACGDLTIELAPDPFAITVTRADGSIVQHFTCVDARPASGDTSAIPGGLSFLLGDGPLFGLGQGGPQFDRRGNLDRMISGQGGYRLATNGGKVPVQFLIGASGWAIFVHSPLGAFDLTGQTAGLVCAADLPLDLFVIGAREPGAIMQEYARITGLAELPPLWSFGYQQSHRTLGEPEEILAESQTFRDKGLPCDAMIYLGTDFCPNGWNTHNGEFTWNPKAFPDPAHAIDTLHQRHFKVVLHTVLEGRRMTGTVNDPCTAAPLPSGRTPDGKWPDDRQVSCYWPVHKPLFDLGIDGWWPDQGDGLDAPSRLARNRMYFEGSQMYRPDQRVYALNRNGAAGMQRISAFLWSGDVNSTWETLKTHVPVAVNAGLSGIPYWGTDIGGFVPTAEYTGELYLRWFQFGAFCPLFRSHGRDWRLHTPFGWTVGEIGVPETPSYHPSDDVLHNPAIEPLCKKYLELRYQLLPYLYSAVKECNETGMPIMRALWLHYPNDPVAVARGDEFLFGRDILVAPVTEPGAVKRTLYLPWGTWFDFWTGEKIAGGREIDRAVDLATMPIYIREGAVIPVGPVKQYVDEPVSGPTVLRLHPGADGAFSLYEDDGKTFNYRQGDYTRIEVAWRNTPRQVTMRLAPGSRLRAPARREFAVQLPGEVPSAPFYFEGRPLIHTVPRRA